jgi:hypothetical protein
MEAPESSMGGHIGDLPAEVILHTLAFLTPVDLLRAEVVSHEWDHLIRYDEHTWRTVYQSSFGGPQASGVRPPQ